MQILVDNLDAAEVAALLKEHLDAMRRYSPPESRHALDLEGLRKPEITFWTAWENNTLVGCGALKEIDPTHGEIKSMRTSSNHLRKGVASRILEHILQVARSRNYRRVSLETGSMAAFEPARRLYAKFGFQNCDPFGEYRPDSNSVFMTMTIE